MAKRIIVHITSEVAPFYKRGGLGDVTGALPRYLSNEEYENVVFSQYYQGKMNYEESFLKSTAEMNMYGLQYTYHRHSTVHGHVMYYFLNLIDSDVFSVLENHDDGDQPYRGESSFMYYLYFAKTVLDTLQSLKIKADFIICHDWQTAGIFAFKQELDRLQLLNTFKTIYLIHNYEFQGEIFFPSFCYLPDYIVNEIEPIYQKYNTVSMLALGLEKCDFIATVSKSYAQELLDGNLPHKYLHYLHDKKRIVPFLNGVDYSLWHPGKSPYLSRHYAFETREVKQQVKKEVLSQCGFDTDAETCAKPLVLVMSRLTTQKGIQLLLSKDINGESCLGNLIKSGILMIIYGVPAGGVRGEIHKNLVDLQEQYKGKFYYNYNYEEQWAHRYLAASDMFLAPSLFEPCGLTQIYAMAFGTIPIVRPVGGLKDTVIDNQQFPESSTGFYIHGFNSKELVRAVGRAKEIFLNDPVDWSNMMKRAMLQDFSWEKMKQQYFDFFESVLDEPISVELEK